MSLKSCDPCWQEEARIQQITREWREWFTVVMTTVKDGPLEIYRALPGLQVYAPHPKDPDALVAEWYAHELDRSIGHWVLELRYSTDVEAALNPLAVPAVIELDTQIREVAAIYDADGNPVLNTAGDLMTDPAPTQKLVDQTISISKNIGLNLPAWVQTHPGCVNSDDVQIKGLPWPAGTLFCARRHVGPDQNVPGTTQTTSTLRATPYVTVDLELWYRADGWVELFPNRGWFQLVPKIKPEFKRTTEVPGQKPLTAQQLRAAWRKLPAYTRQRITVGPLGDFPPEPVFLDANGAAIVNPTFDDILLIRYDAYSKVAFNDLPLR
ncbi:MAG: hypothetical protein KGL39_22545 [Patescibacteria group bacterium]|nr:hypothetical protein [Patescibacteria group bacterium]